MRRFGANMLAGGEVEFSLWAPDAGQVAVALEGGPDLPMQASEDGMFMARARLPAGTRYRYRIDGGQTVPDPASQAQAGDVHDASLVVSQDYDWNNPDWRGRDWVETVVYELHPGACGGFKGIEALLPRLKALGITAVELMPIADFPGRHNWGYDGVLPYAPDAAYGTPDALKHMIDAAHGLGLQVFLDVVYNHFGPDGNYLNVYAKSFFREDIHTPWGNSIDFRKPAVREFFIGNAVFWLNSYRFDGLRLDAVHAIDDSGFLLEMAAAIRRETAGRQVHLVLENENNDAALLNAAEGEQKFDAQWADDWHHCAHVLLTRESEGYYEDFQSPARQMARCLTDGFAYQGDASPHHEGKPRGVPSGHLPPSAFVICLQNHDQIGNRAMGERLTVLAHPQALRAAAALLLFTPQIPMIFMGEEYGEKRPFLFFTDHHDELGRLVTEGRRKEFAHFAAFSNPETREKIPDPNAASTFEASVPQPAENEWTELYAACLGIRAREIMPRMKNCRAIEARALSGCAVRASWRMGDGAVMTVAANFDAQAVNLGPVAGAQLFGPPEQDRILPGYSTCLWVRA